MIHFHILTNDYVKRRGLLAEHGLSIWIEKDGKKILFDTGESWVFSHNAKRLGLNIEDIDHIILSHGHYDHTGGISYFQGNHKAKLHLHPKTLTKKYIQEDQSSREIGVPWKLENIIFKENIVYNIQPFYLDDDILLSGQIPSITDFEDIPHNFLTKENGEFFQDLLIDEQMLIIKEKEGIVIFLGCAHPGVINSLKYASKLYPGEKILGLIGGMHLEKTSPIRLQQTIAYIENMGVEKIIPLHCTGLTAIGEIKRFLGDRCILFGAGDSMKL